MIINNSIVTGSISSTIITECELHDVVDEGYGGEIELLRAIIAAERAVTESSISISIITESVIGNFFSKLIEVIKKLFSKVTGLFSKLINSLGVSDRLSLDIFKDRGVERDVFVDTYTNMAPRCSHILTRNVDTALNNIERAIDVVLYGIPSMIARIRDTIYTGTSANNGDIAVPEPMDIDDNILIDLQKILGKDLTDNTYSMDITSGILGDPCTVPVTQQYIDELRLVAILLDRNGTKYGARLKKDKDKIELVKRNVLKEVERLRDYLDTKAALSKNLNHDENEVREYGRTDVHMYNEFVTWGQKACSNIHHLTSMMMINICEAAEQVTKAIQLACEVYTKNI
jgi:hypothetical protein